MIWLWAAGLVMAAFAAHWGAEQLSAPLQAVRTRFGIEAAAGGALVALASASSDIAVNTASAVTGAAAIGLGNLLGSNVVSIPLVVTAAFVASRKRQLGGGQQGGQSDGQQDHRAHVERGLLRVERDSVKVIALPYLAVIALFTLLTVPPAWRGLQPVDGVLLLLGYAVFLTQAVLRGRQQREDVQWSTKKTWLAVGGIAVLALASYVIVTASQQIGNALGLPILITGLFVTSTMTALPAVFTTWAVVRSGQVTSGVSNPFADNAVAMTLAAFPLALVTLPVDDVPVYLTVLVFVAVMPALYAVLLHRGGTHGLRGRDVALLGATLVTYLAVVAGVLLLT